MSASVFIPNYCQWQLVSQKLADRFQLHSYVGKERENSIPVCASSFAVGGENNIMPVYSFWKLFFRVNAGCE